jgi:hypothetical protein
MGRTEKKHPEKDVDQLPRAILRVETAAESLCKNACQFF